MTFYKFLIWTGVTATIFGLLVLIFQATMYLVFDFWYAFSIMDMLQRLRLHDYLVTNLDTLNKTIDLVLGVPLAALLIVFGGLLGLFGFHSLREETKWSPPE